MNKLPVQIISAKKLRISHLFLLAIFAFTQHMTWSQAPVAQTSTVLSAQIDSLIKRYVAEDKFNGVILVARGGQVIYRNAFGLANREWNNNNSLLTKFRVGSITKPFTAVLVFKAVEKGLLRLEGKVKDYLPDFPEKNASQITIRQLLSHTSGLIDFPDVAGLEWNKERLEHTQQQVLAYFRIVP